MLELRFFAAASIAAFGAFAGSAHATTTPPKIPVTRGVVLVTTDLAYEQANAAGTGIVLTSDGEILTNNHVIRGATTITVILPSNLRRYSATVIGYDISDDVALLKLNGASGLATATTGNSAKLKIGAATTAVGNANGGGRLVITQGRVTALNRSITVNDEVDGARPMRGLIQTSSRLVPGDSGGPLLDAFGHVIGIDSAGSANYQFTVSDGYAIPINKAIGLVKQMHAGKASALVHIGKTAFVGMSVEPADGGGLLIDSVVPSMPADAAGLAEGDVVSFVDGKPVDTVAALRAALFTHHPGDTIALGYSDTAGQQQSATLTLADGPPQ
jgi:S1-C subfamily serine protease